MKLFKALPKNQDELSEVYALKFKVKSKDFPQEIFLIPELKELYLEGVCENFHLREQAFLKLKKLSVHFPFLENQLTDLFGLSELENLKIQETPVRKILFPIGRKLAPLKSLTLKKTQLTELPLEISMLSELEELSLSQNELSALPDSLQDLTKLKRLNLDQNKFKFFPEIILKIPHLSHLSLDGNLFSENEKERIQRKYQLTVF
jgi:Leucine-rich repeat (LRR) protein